MSDVNNLTVFLEEIGLGDEYNPSGDVNKFFSLQPKMSEKVKEKDIVKWSFAPESGRILIVPLYDVHTGSKSMFRDLFERTIEYIYETPDCYTILGGDMLESATRQSIGMGIFEEDMHLSDQMRYLQDALSPLVEKGKVLASITGNHEMRPMYLNKWNPIEELAYDLEIPYLGYQGYLVLQVNDIKYKVFIHHGTGGGRTKGAKVNAAMRPNQVALADLYITGHLHDRFAISDTIFDIENDQIIHKQRHYVAAGSFLQYFGGYPEMTMLAPSIPGTILIELNGEEKSIHTHV